MTDPLIKEEPETRWVDEGGSGQHFTHTDEPVHPVTDVEATADPFARPGSPDASWSRFNATYGRHYGSRFVPGRNDGNEIEREKIARR